MKVFCVCILISLSVLHSYAQKNIEYKVRKQIAIPDFSLYYAATPTDDSYSNNKWTYFRFLPDKMVSWYLNSLAPQAQDSNNAKGIIAGSFPYTIKKDTVIFVRSFNEQNLNQIVVDSFTCIMYKDSMSAILDERIKGAAMGSTLRFSFKLYKP